MPITDLSRAYESDAAKLLQSSPDPALRDLQVEETEAAVILTGCVPSYYLKQLAQETVLPACRGRELLNRTTVTKELDTTPSEGAEKTPLSAELRHWAEEQFTDEEILLGLREVRENGGLELDGLLKDLSASK